MSEAFPVAVDVGHIEREIARFWREAFAGGEAVLRACAVNLVVACSDEDDARAATALVARLAERHPGRAVLVTPRSHGAREPLAAYVSAHCHRGPGGAKVCCEQITLEVAPHGAALVPETVVALLAGDCPAFLWWRRPGLGDDALWEPLAFACDRVIADSTRFADPAAALGDLLRLARSPAPRHPSVGDLLWVRLERWRDLVASFFDAPPMQPFLAGLRRVELACGGPAGRGGTTAAGAYLAGWLASRLGWREAGNAWYRPDGAPVAVVLHHVPPVPAGATVRVALEAEDETGRRATFVAERQGPDEEAVRLLVQAEGACPLPCTRLLRKRDDVTLLARELERDAEDPVYLAALQAAARFAA